MSLTTDLSLSLAPLFRFYPAGAHLVVMALDQSPLIDPASLLARVCRSGRVGASFASPVVLVTQTGLACLQMCLCVLFVLLQQQARFAVLHLSSPSSWEGHESSQPVLPTSQAHCGTHLWISATLRV